MLFLGDVHTNINFCKDLSNQNPDQIIFQIGDLGAGFVSTHFLINELPKNFKFIRGNHDCPQECPKIPNYLGDFGEFNKVFFASGADSIDKGYRTVGVDWWADEQLNYEQANACLAAWEKSNCRIIASHDGPHSLIHDLYGIRDASRTRKLLQAMLEIRKPDIWIFGHHHKPRTIKSNGVEFYALGIDEVLNLTEV